MLGAIITPRSLTTPLLFLTYLKMSWEHPGYQYFILLKDFINNYIIADSKNTSLDGDQT